MYLPHLKSEVKMKKLLIVFVILISSSPVISQTLQNSEAGNQNIVALDGNGTNLVQGFDARYEGVKGSPYFSEDWIKGSVYLTNEKFHDVSLKYNVHENMILAKSLGRVISLQLNKVDSFDIGKGAEMTRFVKVSSETLDGFMEKIFSNQEIMILRQHKKKFIKANYQGAFAGGNEYDEFKNNYRYYYYHNGSLKEYKNNSKGISEIPNTPGKKEIGAMIKKNNVDFNSVQDLKRFFESMFPN